MTEVPAGNENNGDFCGSFSDKEYGKRKSYS